jgi:hypothetical protein
MPMRASQLAVLCLVVRCPVTGYYDKGKSEVFRELERAGLLDRPFDPVRRQAWEYFITAAGQDELVKRKICVLCGDYDSYQERTGFTDAAVRWQQCSHGGIR